MASIEIFVKGVRKNLTLEEVAKIVVKAAYPGEVTDPIQVEEGQVTKGSEKTFFVDLKTPKRLRLDCWEAKRGWNGKIWHVLGPEGRVTFLKSFALNIKLSKVTFGDW